MEDIQPILKELGAKNALEIELDENRAATLELADGRVMLLQERADLNELDFVATLGPVPDELRAEVFTRLLAANFYWQETFGATISWNAELEEAVIIYPLALAGADPGAWRAAYAGAAGALPRDCARGREFRSPKEEYRHGRLQDRGRKLDRRAARRQTLPRIP